MPIIVQKFGGTSVGSIERIRHVAHIIKSSFLKGDKIVVVVSAMAGSTNNLASMASTFNPALDCVASDFVVSTGEQVSAGLLSLALKEVGIEALPLAGWQVPICTTSAHSKAKVQDINGATIHQLLENNIVPVVAGFQGMYDKKITTLGRGGSDTSAVALAAALQASMCDIYTDIDGIYTADPRIVPDCRLIPSIASDMALEMTSHGAKVINPRAVQCSIKNKINLRVRSSFDTKNHSLVHHNLVETSPEIIGMAHILECVAFKVVSSEAIEGFLAYMEESFEDKGIDYDMVHKESHNSISFCVPKSDEYLVLNFFKAHNKAKFFHEKIGLLGKLTLVGKGVTPDSPIMSQALKTLAYNQISVHQFFVSSQRVSFLLDVVQTTAAIKILHDQFLMSPPSAKGER